MRGGSAPAGRGIGEAGGDWTAMNAAFMAGFLGVMGVLAPHFVRAVDVGMHNRVLGWCLLAGACFCALPRLDSRGVNWRDGLMGVVFLGLVACYSTGAQLGELVHVPSRLDYYGEKTAMTVQVCLPPLVAGLILSVLRMEPGFWSGIRAGAITSGCVAMGVMILNRHLLLSQTWVERAELRETGVISVIGFSLVLCFAVMAILGKARESSLWKAAISVGLAMPFLAAIIMIQQRSHLVFVCLIGAAMMFSWRQKARGLCLCAVVCGMAVIGWQFREYIVGPQVQAYWDALLSGESASFRWQMMDFAMRGFWENPVGRGVGAFSLDYPFDERMLYPHNLMAEAAYELGIPGVILVSGVMVAVIKRFWKTPGMAAGFCLFALLHLMKSADFASTELLWFFLSVSRPAVVFARQMEHRFARPSLVQQSTEATPTGDC